MMDKFINSVASSTPTPGGGAVAATVGALGAALTHMVAGLTAGRRKYRHVEAETQAVLEAVAGLREQLTQAIEEDQRVYQHVMTLLRYQNERNEASTVKALEDALIGAAEVPLSVARLSRDVVHLAHKMVAIGNRHAAADAAVGGLMAQAAVRASALNVRANLKDIQDAKLRRRWVNEVTRIEKEVHALVEEMLAKVDERMTATQAKPRRRRRRGADGA